MNRDLQEPDWEALKHWAGSHNYGRPPNELLKPLSDYQEQARLNNGGKAPKGFGSIALAAKLGIRPQRLASWLSMYQQRHPTKKAKPTPMDVDDTSYMENLPPHYQDIIHRAEKARLERIRLVRLIKKQHPDQSYFDIALGLMERGIPNPKNF